MIWGLSRCAFSALSCFVWFVLSAWALSWALSLLGWTIVMRRSERRAAGRVDLLGNVFARLTVVGSPPWLTVEVGHAFLLIVVRLCALHDCRPEELVRVAPDWDARVSALWEDCPHLTVGEARARVEALLAGLPVAVGEEYDGPDTIAPPSGSPVWLGPAGSSSVCDGGSVCGVPSAVQPLEPVPAPRLRTACCHAAVEASGRCSSCGNKARVIEP